MKKILLKTAIILAAAFLLPLSVFAADGPFGIALSWTDDTSATMTVTWRDSAEKKRGASGRI